MSNARYSRRVLTKKQAKGVKNPRQTALFRHSVTKSRASGGYPLSPVPMESSQSMHLTDSMGLSFETQKRPQRVISLVPSTTETIFAIGAGSRLVGRTRFCIHPREELQGIASVGGTKNPKLDRVRQLEPDLILANREENREQDVLRLREIAPVYVAFPRRLQEAMDEIRHLGHLLHHRDEADQLVRSLERSRAQLSQSRRFRYLYLIWRQPYMAAGRGCFIDALLEEAGGENALDETRGRYPELAPEEIDSIPLDVLLLSSEPFPFHESHAAELRSRSRGRLVLLVEGAYLSWHGARLRQGLPYLKKLAERIAGVTR